MDPNRFDTLARSLTDLRSRRGALATLLGGTLGLLGLAGTAAKNGKKGKKKKKKDRNPSPPPPPGADQTCADGIKNGSESDVDCGGACPRCANGRNCRSRDDCASAFCANGTCQTCATHANCGSDARGMCYCFAPDSGGPKICFADSTDSFASCNSCPPGTTCFAIGATQFACFKPCGAP